MSVRVFNRDPRFKLTNETTQSEREREGRERSGEGRKNLYDARTGERNFVSGAKRARSSFTRSARARACARKIPFFLPEREIKILRKNTALAVRHKEVAFSAWRGSSNGPFNLHVFIEIRRWISFPLEKAKRVSLSIQKTKLRVAH